MKCVAIHFEPVVGNFEQKSLSFFSISTGFPSTIWPKMNKSETILCDNLYGTLQFELTYKIQPYPNIFNGIPVILPLSRMVIRFGMKSILISKRCLVSVLWQKKIILPKLSNYTSYFTDTRCAYWRKDYNTRNELNSFFFLANQPFEIESKIKLKNSTCSTHRW